MDVAGGELAGGTSWLRLPGGVTRHRRDAEHMPPAGGPALLRFQTVEDPDFFLPAVAALDLGIPELEIHHAIRDGELRTVVYRGEVRIPAQVLTSFEERRRTPNNDPSASHE